MIFALADNNAGGLFVDCFQLCGLCFKTVLQRHSVFKEVKTNIVKRTFKRCRILFFDLVGRRRESVRKIAVIGQKKQSRSVLIKPSDGEHTFSEQFRRNKFKNVSFLFICRRNKTARFVQHQIHKLRRIGRHSVHGYLCIGRNGH